MGALNPQPGRSQIAAHIFVVFTYILKKAGFHLTPFRWLSSDLETIDAWSYLKLEIKLKRLHLVPI